MNLFALLYALYRSLAVWQLWRVSSRLVPRALARFVGYSRGSLSPSDMLRPFFEKLHGVGSLVAGHLL